MEITTTNGTTTASEIGHSQKRFISPERADSSLVPDGEDASTPKGRFISPEGSHCNASVVVVDSVPYSVDDKSQKARFISPDNSQTTVMNTAEQDSFQGELVGTAHYASSPELLESGSAPVTAVGDSAGDSHLSQDQRPAQQSQPDGNETGDKNVKNKNISGEATSTKSRKPVTRRRSIRSLIMQKSDSSEKVAPPPGDGTPAEHQAVNGGVASDQRSGSHKLKANVDRKSSKKAAGQIKVNIEKEYVHETSLTYLQAMEQILQEADEDALDQIIQEISSVKQKRQSSKLDSSMDVKVPAEKPLELDHEHMVLESEPPTESSGIASMDMYEEDMKKRGSSLPAGMMLQSAKPYSKSMELSYSSVSPPCLKSSPITQYEGQEHGQLEFTYESMSNETLDSHGGDDLTKGYMYGYSSTPARPDEHEHPLVGGFEQDNGIIEGQVDSFEVSTHNKPSQANYSTRSASTLPASTSKPPISAKPSSVSASHVLPSGHHLPKRQMRIPGYVLSAKNIQGAPLNTKKTTRYVSPPEAKSVTLPRAWADEEGQPDPSIVRSGEEEKEIPSALLQRGHVLKKVGVFEQVVTRHTTSQGRLQGRPPVPPKVKKQGSLEGFGNRVALERSEEQEENGDRPIPARRKHIKHIGEDAEDGDATGENHRPPEGSDSNTSHHSDGYSSVLQTSIPTSDADMSSNQSHSQKSYLRLSVSSAGYNGHSSYGSDLKAVDIDTDSKAEREQCEGQEEVIGGHVETSGQGQVESESESRHLQQNGYSVGIAYTRTEITDDNKHDDVSAVVSEESVSQENGSDLNAGQEVHQSDSQDSATSAYSDLTDMLAADIVNEQIRNVYADLRQQQKQQQLQQQQQQQQQQNDEVHPSSQEHEQELSVDFTHEGDVEDVAANCDVPKTSDSLDTSDLNQDQMTSENHLNSCAEQGESTPNSEALITREQDEDENRQEVIDSVGEKGEDNFAKDAEESESDELVEDAAERRNGTECNDETDEAVKLRDIVAGTIQESTPKKDGHYFLNAMHEEERRLQHLCDLAEADLQQEDLSDDVAGILRAATGKAHLMLHLKFKQFGELCEKNLSPDPDDPFETRGGDLAGFWDMVLLQIEDLDSMFVQIDRMRASGWRDMPEEKNDDVTPLSDEKKMSSKVKTPVKHSPRSKTPRSEAAKKRDEARKRMLATKRKEMRIRRSSSGDEEFLEIFVPENVHPPL
ncbi:uncharacterized protein LOC106178960 isoform X2 [Lingula anatina]|uniref:Uncharacterized protein LOC106178960 isoform X2 n=1 Tax=Lingula anatina TaxID=7574 RepID=A0A2R2MKI9_LINAN|nr:uncharacterized protein LOC106178960 isoform X2 [Lingula anatina]|eukprot:XP_023930731.1 uncharacterized protein LOC106178960 isoform X2 [Lingula anatina]